MNLEIIKAEKDDVELKIDNLTIAEIMRVYLNEQGVDLGVWRREHPFKPLTMKIQSSNAKKSVSDAVDSIKKDLEKLSAAVKKSK
jgi:DNA-directed RNA polymerase subunit L